MPRRKKRKPGPKPLGKAVKIVGKAYLDKKGVGKKTGIYHNRFVKEKAVDFILSGRGSTKTVAKRLGVSQDAVMAWVRKARNVGKIPKKTVQEKEPIGSAKKALKRGRPKKVSKTDEKSAKVVSKKRKKAVAITGKKTRNTRKCIRCDKATKKQALKLIFGGEETITSIANKLGVAYTTVFEWVRREERKKETSFREKNKRMPARGRMKLKPTSLITDWTIDYKIAECGGHTVCSSCLVEINEGDLCVVLKDPRKSKKEIHAHCFECFFLDLNETKKYLEDLKKIIMADDMRIYVDLSGLHNKYNCVYRKRRASRKRLKPIDSLTKGQLIKYLENEKTSNLPDKLKQVIELEKKYFDQNDIPELIRIKTSAFIGEEVRRLREEEGKSIRHIAETFKMAHTTVRKILKRHESEEESVRSKAMRLQRENRHLRRVLCHFAEKVL